MSQENADVVRRYIQAIQALEDKALQSEGRRSAWLDLPEARATVERYWHPEAVFETARRLDGGVYHGPAGVMQASREWLTGWEDFQVEYKEFISVGDRVVAVMRHRGTAEGGIEVEHDFYAVATVRHGQLVHVTEHRTRERAIAAAEGPA
jgi:hypothetical protein